MLTLDSNTWEHLVTLLEQEVDVKMDAEQLENQRVAEIIKNIVDEWGKKEKVTPTRFCEVCEQLGITRMQEVLEEAEDNLRNSISQNV